MASTNITGGHKRAVEAPEIGGYRDFAPVSCFVDGGPAAAIATVRPLFIPVTPAMRPTDHAGAGA